jgi:hypothetical protein
MTTLHLGISLRSWVSLGLLATTLGSAACAGLIGDGVGDDDVIDAQTLGRIGEGGLRRLTIREYNDTVLDLLGDDTAPATQWLPEDQLSPFDNDYTGQVASAVLIEGAETVATEIAARFVANSAVRDQVVGCTPTGGDDATCFRDFVTRFGRRAFRRPLSVEEIEGFMAFLRFGTAQSSAVTADFYTAVETAVRAFLQHPKFLYRVEVGTPVEGHDRLFKLDSWDKATRLSYLLWGTGPNDALLDIAAADGLATTDMVRSVAAGMLTDPRALSRIDRFHALWFGYDTLPLDPALTSAMRRETEALLERVVFSERLPWTQVFLSNETFVDEALAEHYGLAVPADSAGGWVSYEGTGRKGLLSHGSYLAANILGSDTSPTLRGKAIRTRLFCEDIPPPPETVNKDDLPESDSPCKKDVRAVYMTGACYGCHSKMDPIGYGLENYDAQGRYRTHEPDHPECTIDGEGRFEGIGDFNGPSGLADLLTGSPDLQRCVTTQLYRFAMGHYKLSQADARFVRMIVEGAGPSDGMRFDDLLLAFVASDEFGFRLEEEPEE